MKRHRALLLLVFVVLLFIAAGGLWWHAIQKQDALNRDLIAALLHDDTKQALELVNAGADINTPLYPPSPSFQRFVGRWLSHDLPSEHNGPSAFVLACGFSIPVQRNGKFEETHVRHNLSLVKGMFLHGADANAGTDTDNPLLEIAVMDSEPDVVELLLQHGAKVNEADSAGVTPLIWASIFCQNKVPLLLQYHADVNLRGHRGETALYELVYTTRNKDLIRQLLAHGADPNIATGDGSTALSVAKSLHRLDLVALLKSGSK
jgi:ankyrin repeat protein